MMERYLDIAANAYSGYWNYLRNELLHPSWHNYLYWLIGLSLLVWSLEIVLPWRKNQRIVRRDFWLDGFYMFFNFFLFSLIVYNAVSEVAVTLFNDALSAIGVRNTVALHIGSWPAWAQLLFLFVVADFIQWNVHRLLHRVPWLWEFHKVHHSVKEMGFAAHLRFHWMETIVYRAIQFIPLSMIGYGLDDLFIMHIVATLIGHLNHSNINLGWGPLKYVFNSPRMHIWHHARTLPSGRYGVNYGLSLSVWDFLFGTAWWPKEGRDIELGFPDDEHFPKTFLQQVLWPFRR